MRHGVTVFVFKWDLISLSLTKNIVFYINNNLKPDLTGALYSHIKRAKATAERALLHPSTAVVYGRNFMRASSCSFQGDPVHSERSCRSSSTLKIRMTVERVHLSQHTVDTDHPMCFSFRME